MALSQWTVSYSPIRVGFLVEEGNVEHLVQVAKANSVLWGGIFNPIIPVGKNQDFSGQLISFFDCDVLQPIEARQKLQEFEKLYPHLENPMSCMRLFYEDWKSKKNVTGYLGIAHVLIHHQNERRRFGGNPEESNCALYQWNENDSLSNLFDLQFGSYENSFNLKWPLKAYYKDALHPHETVIDASNSVDATFAGRVSPLDLTRDRFGGLGALHQWDGIYAGDESDFWDLLTFWNIRASGAYISFLPKGSDRLNQYCLNYFRQFESEASERDKYFKKINIHYSDDDVFENARRLLDPTTPICRNRMHPEMWRTSEQLPEFMASTRDLEWHGHLAEEKVPVDIGELFGSPTATVLLPKKEFLRDIQDRFGESIAIKITPGFDPSSPGRTLCLPKVPDLSEFYSRQVLRDPTGLRVSRGGLTLLKRTTTDSLWLSYVETDVLIANLFRVAGLSIKISQPGRITNLLLKKLGEDREDALETCRVFKIPGVRKLVLCTGANEPIVPEMALKTIGIERFNEFKRLYIESRRTNALTPFDVWKYLVKKKIFIPALTLRGRLMEILGTRQEYRCNECGLKDQLKLKVLQCDHSCKFCGKEQYLPVYLASKWRRNMSTTWRFLKNDLYREKKDLDGAIPTLLTLLQLWRRLHGFSFVSSSELRDKGNIKCEIDFAIVRYGQRVEIGIGECKSDGQFINADDIRKLGAVYEKLQAYGYKPYLIFSTTAQEFRSEELELFAREFENDKRVIIFSGNELEPYEPYEKHTDLPDQYGNNLDDMVLKSRTIVDRILNVSEEVPSE